MLRQKLTTTILVISAIVFVAPRGLRAQYNINLLGGGGPNGLTGPSSSIGNPGGIASDANGNTYIADGHSHRVFKISSTGTVTVFAGNGFGIGGEGGFSGDGGPATSAELGSPRGLAVDAGGDVFIADSLNNRIRCVVGTTGGCFGSALAVGSITTVVGTGTACQPTGSTCGDGGPASAAQLNGPAGVFVDSMGNLYLADTDDSKIRCVVGVAGGCVGSALPVGSITTVAGTGTAGYSGDGAAASSAQINLPSGLFVDSTGDLIIADTNNSSIRCVVGATSGCLGSTLVVGSITTLAGTGTAGYSGDGAVATAAQLNFPGGLFMDSSKDIYIADTDNSRIRCILAVLGGCLGSNLAVGDITTITGTGTAGFSGDGTAAASAEVNLPNALIVDSSNDVFIADTDNFRIRCVVGTAGGCLGSALAAGDITSLAGNGTVAYSGDGGAATSASLNASSGVAVDGSGNVFIADTENNVIREIVKATGNIITVAGTGAPCNSKTLTACGDGGLATSAQLNVPQGVFVDKLGDIFIADTGDFAVRCVVGTTTGGCFGSALPAGSITTVAGTGTSGYSGDNAAATSAEIAEIFGVFVDSAGNLFIADTGNSRIRCVAAVAGACLNSMLTVGSITTVAGNGIVCNPAGSACGDGAAATSAQLNFPQSVSGDSANSLFIADTLDSKIRCVVVAAGGCFGSALTAGSITSVVGGATPGYSGDGGAAGSALVNEPGGVFVDNLGNLFIADTDNSVVREVVNVTGNIQTIAGNGTAGYSGDGGPGSGAQLAHPLSIVGDTSSHVFIADTENSRIRELTSTVSVTILPTSATLPTGGPQQFAANVTGASNSSVTWQVNGITGGNATVGTISNLGSYMAPANVPGSPTVTVTAVPNANGVNPAPALVTIVSGSTTATVTISANPTVTTVYINAMQTFVASTTNPTGAAVNWEVNGVMGGNSTVGTISASGVYTAPTAVPAPATVLIGAVLQSNSSVSASYPILIAAVPTAPAPASQTISSTGSATYSMALDGKSGYAKQALTLSCLKSSLPTGATCEFTPPTIVPGTSSVPFKLTITLPACAALLERPAGIYSGSPIFFSFLPVAAILLAGLGRGKKRRQWLLMLVLLVVPLVLLVGCGGGGGSSGQSCPNLAGTYNVVVQGTIPGQPNPITITTVTLIVQ